MEFRLLGPVEARVAGRPVPLGGPRATRALAALLLADGRVVGVDALVDALWDGPPPATAVHQLHKVIGTLRRRVPVETVGRGYRLAADDLDVTAFDRLVAAGSAADLAAALALWRGPALAGVSSLALRAAAAGLDERRVAAAEALARLRLAAGRADLVAAELPALVAAHPLRESLRVLLVTALHRCGRRADALAAVADARAVLAEELGLDPGPALTEAHARVLRGDPAPAPTPDLAPAPAAAPGPEPVPAGGLAAVTLPYDLPDFAGRVAELDRLLAAGPAVVITAIDGMAGVGKTALAVHAAHRLAAAYPDGRLFCDLHAHTAGSAPLDPAAALHRLLRMAGAAPDTIPDGLDERAARWRAELAGRRVLVVLDNAASAAQVRPLLPGSPDCLVLVTSRRRLGVVEGATVLSLDVLPAADALALFAAVAGADRVAAEPAAAAEVVELCGRLPLAVRIAATRLAHRPQWTVAALAGRLRARPAELALADRGVAAAFALSYADLPAAGQRLFRLLGRHPGADFDAWSVAALADLTVRAAEDGLEALVDAHLLRPAGPDRYTFHDLLRAYARDLGPADAAAAARLHDFYLAAATAATDLVGREARRFDPGAGSWDLPPLDGLDGALGWLGAEHATLVAVALATPDWRLACVLRAYFEHGGHFADWRATHEHALAGADPLGTALLEFSLGGLAMWTGRVADGMAHFRAALAVELADERLRASMLTSLGMLAHLLHRDAEAAGYLRRALAIEHGDPRTRALGWNNLALTEGRTGRRAAALAHHRQALALARRCGSASAERAVLLGLGESALRLGLPAEEPFREALELARRGRFRMQEALALDGLAHATGDPAHWRDALAILADLGVDRADLVRDHLADPDTPWCDLCGPGTRPARQATG
jgi:DNA-binding SARP family transcriptional activator/tetratricopeptide (TPR) repeat protein